MHITKPFSHIFVILVIVLALLTNLKGTSESSPNLSQPHFSKSAILFRLEDQFLYARLSSDGEYVFAHGIAYKDENFSNGYEDTAYLHLWSIAEILRTGPLAAPQPVSSLAQEVTEQEYVWRGSFSPDGNRLAFRTDTKLEILDLPDLERGKSISPEGTIPTRPSWDWSTDGNLLAVLTTTEIAVWEIDTDRIETYPLENSGQYGALQHFGEGWLLTSGSRNQPTLFGICTRFLENCTAYEHPDKEFFEVASADTQIILASMSYVIDDMTLEIGVWHRQADNQYSLTKTLPRDVCRPRNFSPDSRYLAVYCYDSRYWQIWDFETLEVLSSIVAASTEPFWLPDSQHLVALERGAWNLMLYEADNSEPLEVLHLPSIAGFEQLPDWVDGERFSIESISADGDLVLINLGWASILVPIVYE